MYKYIPNNEKIMFGSKYTPIASITKLADQQVVDFFKSHNFLGHSIGIDHERNLHWNILALSLTGVYDLNGRVEATPKTTLKLYKVL